MPVTTSTGDCGGAVVAGGSDMLATIEDSHALTVIDHPEKWARTSESTADD